MDPTQSFSKSAELTIPHGITRRKWLKRASGAFGIAMAAGIYSWRIEPHWVEVVRRDLPIQNLPEHLHDRTLVQISDLHIGPAVEDAFLEFWFRQIAEWQPDIVAFTGDFLTLRRDNSLPVSQMKRVLSQFPQGKLATIGVLGNHDYGLRWSDSAAGSQVTGIATNAGIQILRNQVCDVEGLQFVGFDDWWGPNFGGKRVLEKVDLTRPTVTLCHNPDVVDLPIWSNYSGWILSGHTHGGQCRLPYLTPPKLPIDNKRYSSGEFLLSGGRRLYVNQALGHSMRVRFCVRPEVTLFRLVEAKLTELNPQNQNSLLLRAV